MHRTLSLHRFFLPYRLGKHNTKHSIDRLNTINYFNKKSKGYRIYSYYSYFDKNTHYKDSKPKNTIELGRPSRSTRSTEITVNTTATAQSGKL